MNFIDLFAGAGGLSEGFIKAGYKPVAHVEMDKAASYTLKTRIAYHYLSQEGKNNIYLSYLKRKISREQLYSHIPPELLNSVINLPIGPENNHIIHKEIDKQRNKRKIDLIIGGPPCQAYSLVGRARSKTKMEGDHRNYLYKEYANYLTAYNPSYFVFENVMGLLSASNGLYLQNMEKLFNEKGYKIKPYKVEAHNFGVLQKRKRIIIVGWKNELNPKLPELEAIRYEGEYLVRDLLVDLPEINAGGGTNTCCAYKGKPSRYLKKTHIRKTGDVLTQHVARPHSEQDKTIYREAVYKWNKYQRLNYNDLDENLKTHKNRHSFFDRFKVVADNLKFSHTVVAHIAKDGHYYIHPDAEQNRSISVREAARLQSFPDNYYFEGVKEYQNRTAAFKQIGNAVPPLMAEAIARELKVLF